MHHISGALFIYLANVFIYVLHLCFFFSHQQLKSLVAYIPIKTRDKISVIFVLFTLVKQIFDLWYITFKSYFNRPHL